MVAIEQIRHGLARRVHLPLAGAPLTKRPDAGPVTAHATCDGVPA